MTTKAYKPTHDAMIAENCAKILQVMSESKVRWLDRKQISKLTGINPGVLGTALTNLVHTNKIDNRRNGVMQYAVRRHTGQVAELRSMVAWSRGELKDHEQNQRRHMELAMLTRR